MKKLILLSCTCLLTYSTFYAQIPTEGLVGHYRLNDLNLEDATDPPYNLEVAGIGGALVPVADRFGEANGALLLSNEYLNLGTDASTYNFDSDSKFSLCGWFKIGTTIPDWTGLLNNWEGFDIGGYYLGLNPTGQLLRWNVNLGGTPIDSAPIPTGSWTHVVANYDGTDAKLYINGTLIGTETYGLDILPSGLPFSVGAQADVNTLQFPGELDDILIYDRAITAEEVTQIYTVLSIEDIELFTSQIQIAPNPTTNSVSIDYNRTLGTIKGYTLVDMVGKTLLSEELKPLTNEINLTPFPSGIYFINFETTGGITIPKRIAKN